MSSSAQERGGFLGLLHMAGAHKGKLAFACGFSLATQLCAVAPFIILFLLVDRVAGHEAATIVPSAVWPLAAAAAVCVVLRYLFFGIANVFSHRAAYSILFDLRIAIAEALPRLPLGFFNQSTSGEIKKVMLEDVERMEVFIGHNLPELVGSALYLLLSQIALFWVDWRLAIASVCLLPVGFLAQVLTIGRNKEIRSKYFTANEKTNGAMVQYFHGMAVIKAFSRTEEAFRGFADSVAECSRYEAEMCRRWSLPMTVFSVALNANILILFPVSAALYLAGSIPLSSVVLFMLVGLGLGNALQQFMTLGSFLEHQSESRKRIDALLAQKPLAEAESPVIPVNNGIAIDNAGFAYGEKQVLFDISAKLEPGRFLALVGPSGAGKSTLARLIPRFWDVTTGQVAVGNCDVREVSMDELMGRMTFVFQDNFLFNDTIEANLRMGKPDATSAELEAATRAAHCHDLIQRLPDGLQHMVGERGGVISGGEKQRLCIARALLKDAPILIMDEATAYIDPENEADIQRALNALVKGKTLVVIAHRLSTITEADQILVVDEGRVAGRGTHTELLEHSELYSRMWHAHMSSTSWTIDAGEAA